LADNNIHDEFHAFFNLEEDKRERIINAALKEFLHGYKHASTDNIVKEAGISKGLLFHYFGTKARLYQFLIDYGIEKMQYEFFDRLGSFDNDIFETIWQLSLLKQEISRHFPNLFDFMTGVYLDQSAASEHSVKALENFKAVRAQILADAYAKANLSLFRDNINPATAMQIIEWTMNGFAATKAIPDAGISLGETARNRYDDYLREYREILDTLKKAFYK